MLPVPTVSDIHFKDLRMLSHLAEVTGVPITSFDTLLAAVDKLFADYSAAGIRAVKFGSAYRRLRRRSAAAQPDAHGGLSLRPRRTG